MLLPFTAALALAHPLGNFTINHYAGIRVEADRIRLDVVIDEAEIPAFQAIQALDTNGDGVMSPSEIEAASVPMCATVGSALTLTVDGKAAPLRLVAAGLSFPTGSGGLSTMRVVCELDAPLAGLAAAGTSIAFADGFELSRIGWREMAATGDGVTVEAPGVPSSGATERLTMYPAGLVGAPDVRSVTLSASPGGAPLAPFTASDATPVSPPVAIVAGQGSGVSAPVAAALPSTFAAPVSAPTAAVPGGDTSIPSILRDAPVTPGLVFAALLAALLLGAGHAVTPGHGKTLMAAYLVGTRGAARHAIGLGIVVAVSHTLGILALAVLVLGAESALAPDLVVRTAPLVAALGIVAVGAWMLASEVRRWRRARPGAAHERPHEHEHADMEAHESALDHHHDHQDHDDRHAHGAPAPEHAHGPIRHSHLPAPGTRVTRRGLFVLGLAGGLVPSANALLILLATVAAGRPAWGVVLVVAFGLGMAGVMAGVGLAVVYGRGAVERLALHRPARLAALVPTTAGLAVLVFGLVLTSGALATASIR
jgi:ABC-type nickel/cobalt efflux system permease component RcnA